MSFATAASCRWLTEGHSDISRVEYSKHGGHGHGEKFKMLLILATKVSFLYSFN
jgi:hypothetical protein